MTRRNISIGLQIILVVAFLLQPIFLPTQPDDIGRSVFSKVILKNLLANTLITAFFYFNYYFLIPRLYFSKSYVGYVIALAVSLSIILTIPSKSTAHLPSQRRQRPPIESKEPQYSHPRFERDGKPPKQRAVFGKFQHFFSDNDQTFFLFGTIVLFSLLLRINGRYYKTEYARQEAEINYLLAQINPHFLFNALNSIYTLTIKEKATHSSTSLLKLSGLLRYVFTETSHNLVPLEKEIACINDFIDLQKLRLTDNVQLMYGVAGDPSGKQLAPMLLMPFIENAFKHGVSPDENSVIHIKIDVEDDRLKMQVNNKKVIINNDRIGKSGLGIENAKNRLQLLYPGKHRLDISETDHLFNVTLEISF